MQLLNLYNNGISRGYCIALKEELIFISRRFLTRIQPELILQVECQRFFVLKKFIFCSKLPENESHDLIIDTLYKSWEIYENEKSVEIIFVIC